MRSAPLNFLLTLGLAGVLWIVFSYVLGTYLGDNVALLQATVQEFVGTYRLWMTVATAAGILLTWTWYALAARPEAVGDMARGSRLWTMLLLTAFSVAVVVTVVLALAFGGEQFSLVQYVLFFLSASALTWILYWASSLLWTPRAWMNVMPPRK